MVTRKDSGESTVSIKLLNLQDRVLTEGGEAGYITCMTQDTIHSSYTNYAYLLAKWRKEQKKSNGEKNSSRILSLNSRSVNLQSVLYCSV